MCNHPIRQVRYNATFERPYVCECGASWSKQHWDEVQQKKSQEAEGIPVKESILSLSEKKPSADEQVLRDWWMDLASEEVDRVVPKAVEYGATDLIEIGRTLGATMHRTGLTEAEQAELGVYFYIVGKIARWTDAVKEGREVSDDTLHDIGVYVRMAQRIRAVGGWPFGQAYLSDEEEIA